MKVDKITQQDIKLSRWKMFKIYVEVVFRIITRRNPKYGKS